MTAHTTLAMGTAVSVTATRKAAARVTDITCVCLQQITCHASSAPNLCEIGCQVEATQKNSRRGQNFRRPRQLFATGAFPSTHSYVRPVASDLNSCVPPLGHVMTTRSMRSRVPTPNVTGNSDWER